MLETMFHKTLRRKGFSIWLIPALFMWLASLVYRLGYYLHRAWPRKQLKADVPVVSIGNITVGGTGKTPMVICLARHLEEAGLRVGIASRGYGRQSTSTVIEPGYRLQSMDVSVVGDEVMHMAHLLPKAVFAIDKSKAAAARLLGLLDDVDLVLVDDAYQHWSLERDIDLVTFDAAVPPRMLRWFPFGLLREPMNRLARADIIVATRSNFAPDLGQLKRKLRGYAPDCDLYSAQFRAGELVGHDITRPLKYIEDKSVFLFAGIGNFRALRRQVMALCDDIDVALELSDHQEYDLPLLQRIKDEADRHNSDVILTTGKDWVKLPDFAFGREIYYLSQSVDLDPGEEKLAENLIERLGLETRKD